MKKRGIALRGVFFLIIIATAISIFAQEGAEDTTNWNKQIDVAGGSDFVTAIAVDSNQNVFVVGSSQNQFAGTSADWWIKKYSPSGVENTTHWNLAYPNGTAWDIVIDQNDSVYIAGYGYDLISDTSEEDWWIKKFYSNGTEINASLGWNKTYDGNDANDQARAVEISPDNRIYVAGYGTNLTGGETGEDWWIKKFNTTGYEFNESRGWNKTFNHSSGFFDRATAIAFDENNTLYVAGTAKYMYSATSNQDWVIKKYNYSGYEYDSTEGWNKTINGNLGVAMIVVNNTVFVAGSGGNLTSATSQNDWWIKRYHINGTEINASLGWNKTFDAAGGDDSVAHLASDSRDNIYVVGFGTNLVSGTSSQDWWIKKFDLNGTEDTTFWNLTFDGDSGNDQPQHVTLNSSDNLFVGGFGSNIVAPAASGLDWWIKSFDGSDPICGVINETTLLEQNISSQTTCIEINASNIILDCQGYTITYGTAGTIGNAVNASGVDNITIQNCNIVEGSTDSTFNQKSAIRLVDVNNATAYNNTIATYSLQGRGIDVVTNSGNPRNNNLSDNRVSVRGSSATGILVNGENSTVMRNKVFHLNMSTTSTAAIGISSNSNYSVVNNNVTTYAPNTQGIDINSNNNIVAFNNVTTVNISAYGIYLDSGDYNNISYNNIRTNRSSAQAIRTNNVAEYNTFFRNNITTYAAEGIYITTDNDFNRVIKNNITTFSGSYGIRVDSGDNSTIEGNIIRSNPGGGLLMGVASQNVTISNNNITAYGNAFNSIGIRLSGGLNYIFMNNSIRADIYEIQATASTGHTFIYNNSFGEIRWTNTSFLNNLTINTTNGIGLGLNIFIGNNTAAVNTSEFYPTGWQINSSANITLLRTGLINIDDIYAVQTFNTTRSEILTTGASCSYCTLISATNDDVFFNTTHFSSFTGVDLVVPNVTIINPVNDSNLSVGVQAFNVSILESNIDQVIFVFNNASGNDFNVTPTNNSGNWNANVDLLRFIESNDHNFTVFANDTTNNVNYTEYIQFTVDRTPPNVSLLNVSFTATTATPDIWVNVTDNFSIVTTCNLYFDGTLSSSATIVNVTETAITAGSLSNAAYTTWVNCTDYSGNVGNSTNITVTVSVASPPASNGGSSGGGSSSGGGGLPIPVETEEETSEGTTEETGELTAEVISETEVTPTETEEEEEAQSATSIATREKEVVIEFRNEGKKTIRLTPTIKEEVIANPEVIKRVGQKRAEEIQLIEEEDVEFITARTRQFGKDDVCGTTSGIKYSQELVTANPLRAALKNKEQFDVKPGENIDKVFNIQSGIAEQVRGITLVFTTDDGQVIEKQIQVSESQGIGSVIDINPEKGALDVYMKIPQVEVNSEDIRNYQLEINIDKFADSKIQPWQTRVPLKLAPTRSALQTIWGEQTAFGELYGTFPVREKNSKIFAQQLLYNTACYDGTFIVRTKVYEENNVLVEDRYTVDFKTGSISDVQRVNSQKVQGNALTAAAVVIEVPQQETNWTVMIVIILMIILLGIALRFGFKTRKVNPAARDAKIAQLKEMSQQNYHLEPKLRKIKHPEIQIEEVKKEMKNLQRSEPIPKRSLNIKSQILEQEKREVDNKLQGYPRKTQVLEMPKRKLKLDAQLAEIENRLSHLDELGLQSAHVKTTLATPKENHNLANERFRKRELSFVAKNLENPFPEKKEVVKSERELIEEKLARREVERISEKISGQKFSVNNERIRVEEKLKKLKDITK